MICSISSWGASCNSQVCALPHALQANYNLTRVHLNHYHSFWLKFTLNIKSNWTYFLKVFGTIYTQHTRSKWERQNPWICSHFVWHSLMENFPGINKLLSSTFPTTDRRLLGNFSVERKPSFSSPIFTAFRLSKCKTTSYVICTYYGRCLVNNFFKLSLTV